MRMRVHDVADRLPGKELLRFRDVRGTACLALPGFEHHDVVLEFDDHGVIAAVSGSQPVETVAQLFVGHGHRSSLSATTTTSRSLTTARWCAGCCSRSTACRGCAAAGHWRDGSAALATAPAAPGSTASRSTARRSTTPRSTTARPTTATTGRRWGT